MMTFWLTRNSIALFFLIAFALNPGWAGAQSPADLTLAQSASMPGWTVPVLRLVSATHVEPTTGVVLSDSGMVLVPADFAGPGDEIIVLDGGTDIIRNGRPAKIIQRFSTEGLQVLSVPALRRRGASFSSESLEDGGRVWLHAYPPAELIAEGKPPVDVETTIVVPAETGQPHVSGETPLPNVTGALVDDCGNLAGYSSANGVQSMATTEFPRYQFRDTLIRLAEELKLNVKMADCRPETATPAEPEAEADSTGPQPSPEEETPQDALPEAVDPAEPEQPEELEAEAPDDPVEPAPEEEGGDMGEPAAEPELLEEVEILPPIEEPVQQDMQAGQTPLEEESVLPAWLWLLFAFILFGGGFLVHRLRSRASPSPDENPSTRPQPLPVSEDAGQEVPFTPGMDSELLVQGELTDGNTFEVRCPVSSQAINLVIGRGQADIPIKSPAISRQHATMNGTAEQLTLSDLGSSNGTSINGVPCLEGETMFIKPGDTIVVGNARFRFTIGPASTEQAAG